MLDDEVRALVSVEPSSDFEARVRATIAQQPGRGWWPTMIVAAATVLLAVAIGHWADSTPFPGPPENAALEQLLPASIPNPGRSLFPGVIPPDTTALVASSGRERERERPREMSRFDVQIDLDEAKALQRLLAEPPRSVAVIVMPAVPELTSEDEAGRIVIPELSIAPLTIDTTSDEGVSR